MGKRLNRNLLDYKKEKMYNDVEEKKSPTKKKKGKKMAYVKYYMDQRKFSLTEKIENKEVVILERVPGLDFYISFEKNEYYYIKPEADKSTIVDRISEPIKEAIENLKKYFKNIDFVLYGLLTEQNEVVFYDLKINDNYMDYEDLVILCNDYSLPMPKKIGRGTFSLKTIKKIILKNDTKEENCIFREVKEAVPTDYDNHTYVYDYTKKYDNQDNLKKKVVTPTVTPVVTKVITPKKDITVTTKTPENDINHPCLYYFMLNENGTINEEAINAYIDYYTSSSYIEEYKNNAINEGFAINGENRFIIISSFNDSVYNNIINDYIAYEQQVFSGNYSLSNIEQDIFFILNKSLKIQKMVEDFIEAEKKKKSIISIYNAEDRIKKIYNHI